MTPESIGKRLATFVLQHRLATIVACLVSFVAVSFGVTKARFSTDYKIFFAEDDPKRLAFERVEQVFSKTDNVVFVVKAADGQDVFTPEALGAVQELTEAAWTLPHASRVDSISNFQHSYAEGEDIIVEELVFAPASELSQGDLADIRTAAFDHPLLVGSLLAEDGQAAGVNVTLRLPGDQPDEVTETTQAARAIAAAVADHHPKLEIRTSGMALMNDAFMEASIQDMSFIFPLMYVVMVVAMLLFLRSGAATAAIVAIVAFSSGVCLGVAGWLGYPLTPPSAAAPTIVLTLAVADGVHLFVSVRAGLRDGLTQREAIIEAVRVNFRPILLTSLTTMVGFACLNFAEAAPYWHLANMTVVGIAAAFIYSVTFLPAVLSLATIKVPRGKNVQLGIMDRLATFTIRFRRSILVVGAVLAVGLGAMAATLETNDRFVEYFDDSIAFRPDAEFMLEELGGLYTVDFQIGSDDGVSHPAYLERLDAFTTWLREQPEVTHVYSVSDIVKRLHMNTHEDDRAQYAIGASRELNGQLLMLYEMSLPFGLDMTDRVDIDKASSRITVTVGDLSSQQMREFTGRAEQWLRLNAPTPMHAQAASPVVIFSHLSDRNTKSMLKGNAMSLALISLCLVVALGSLRLGLLSIVPNVLPIVFGYGLWAVLFSEIDIVASIAGTVCLGIIVDDTIHFLSKYQLARSGAGMTKFQAVRKTFTHVGPALMGTTAIIMLGFGVLTQSGFQMNTHLGLLVVMVVVFALVADLLLLPALLLTLDRGIAPGHEPEEPIVHHTGPDTSGLYPSITGSHAG